MKVVKNVLKTILMIILFPFVIRELGRYVEEIHENDMYCGGG